MWDSDGRFPIGSLVLHGSHAGADTDLWCEQEFFLIHFLKRGKLTRYDSETQKRAGNILSSKDRKKGKGVYKLTGEFCNNCRALKAAVRRWNDIILFFMLGYELQSLLPHGFIAMERPSPLNECLRIFEVVCCGKGRKNLRIIGNWPLSGGLLPRGGGLLAGLVSVERGTW